MRKRLLKFLSTLLFVGLAIYTVSTSVNRSAPSIVADIPVSTSTVPLSASIPDAATTTSSTVQTNANVVRVVDGDTIVALIDGQTKNETIRFLGINTPETVDPRKTVECFGKEASAHMHTLLDGKRVRLEPDLQADERDKYGRLLRNVFLADGTDVNAAMVRDGYAYAYLSFPLNVKRKQQLKKLQEDAKLQQIGLWSTTTCNGQK
jgi:micrococcal nuclease